MKKLIPIIAVIALFVMSSCGQINSDNKGKSTTEETVKPVINTIHYPGRKALRIKQRYLKTQSKVSVAVLKESRER